MEVLHETEQPSSLVAARLSQSLHHTDGFCGVANAVALHARMGEFPFSRVQPTGSQWSVG